MPNRQIGLHVTVSFRDALGNIRRGKVTMVRKNGHCLVRTEQGCAWVHEDLLTVE